MSTNENFAGNRFMNIETVLLFVVVVIAANLILSIARIY